MTGLALSEPAILPERSAVSPQLTAGAKPAVRAATPTLRLEAILRAFGAIRALKAVAFDMRSGETRAVIGRDGARQSSLVDVISGLYRADPGLIRSGGESFSHEPRYRADDPGVGVKFLGRTERCSTCCSD